MRYTYKTSVGTFWIESDSERGNWLLGIDDERLGYYASAGMAADDVASHCTGWYDWDVLMGTMDGPSDLGEWRRPAGR